MVAVLSVACANDRNRFDSGLAAYEARQYENAELIWLEALESLEAKGGRDANIRHVVLHNYGALSRAVGRHDDALELLFEARKMRELEDGDSLPVSATLGEIAAVCLEQRRLDQAEELQFESLRIRRTTLGPRHVAIATSLNNLGLLHQARGDHAEAEHSFHRALSIRQEHLRTEHREVAGVHNNLGVFYRQMGEIEKSEESLRYAVQILERSWAQTTRRPPPHSTTSPRYS